MGRAGALRLAVGRPSCTVCTQEAAARVGHGMLVFSNHNFFSLPSSYFFCVCGCTTMVRLVKLPVGSGRPVCFWRCSDAEQNSPYTVSKESKRFLQTTPISTAAISRSLSHSEGVTLQRDWLKGKNIRIKVTKIIYNVQTAGTAIFFVYVYPLASLALRFKLWPKKKIARPFFFFFSMRSDF